MAKRFRFSLETLLRVRRLREREAQRAVAAKQAEIVQLDRFDDETFAAIHAQHAALLRDQSGARLDPAVLARGRGWLVHLRLQLARRAQERQQRQAELIGLQQILRDARTKTRALEELRERRRLQHRKALNKAEQAQHDERALVMFSDSGTGWGECDDAASTAHVGLAADECPDGMLHGAGETDNLGDG